MIADGLFSHIYRPDKIGRDTIHHDAAHPSALVLLVLSRSAGKLIALLVGRAVVSGIQYPPAPCRETPNTTSRCT